MIEILLGGAVLVLGLLLVAAWQIKRSQNKKVAELQAQIEEFEHEKRTNVSMGGIQLVEEDRHDRKRL